MAQRPASSQKALPPARAAAGPQLRQPGAVPAGPCHMLPHAVAFAACGLAAATGSKEQQPPQHQQHQWHPQQRWHGAPKLNTSLPQLVLDPTCTGWERVYVDASPAEGGEQCTDHDIVDTMPAAIFDRARGEAGEAVFCKSSGNPRHNVISRFIF